MCYQGQDDSLQRWQWNGRLRIHQLVQTMFRTTTPTVTDNLSFHTFGMDLLETAYSKHLIEIVHACLAYMPADRPAAAHILQLAQQVLPIFDRINATTAQNSDRGGPVELGEGPKLPLPRRPPEMLRRFTTAERTAGHVQLSRPRTVIPDAAQVGWPIAAVIPGVPRILLDFPPTPRRTPPVIDIRRSGRIRNRPRRYAPP